MCIQHSSDLLTALRGNLRRIEEYDAQNLTPASLALKQLLIRRIANIEAAMERSNDFARKQPSAKQRMGFSGLPTITSNRFDFVIRQLVDAPSAYHCRTLTQKRTREVTG